MWNRLISAAVCGIKGSSQSGVTTIPIRPDILALKMAPGTFPFAMETITTEEDTVEGKAARNRKASQIVCEWPAAMKGLTGRTSSGNNRKVESGTDRCSFQVGRPLFICSPLRFKP